MMRHDRWHASALVFACLLTGSLYAEEPPPHAGEATAERDPGLTLATVVDSALSLNPDAPTLTARRDEAQALERRGESLIGDNPALYLRHENDALMSDTGFREWEGGVELPLWRWGERAASQRVAQGASENARAEATLLRLEVAGEVREAIWAVAIAENTLTQAQSAQKTASEIEAQVEQRVARGDLAKTDRLLARDETLQQQALVREAELALRHAVLAYRRLTGLDALPLDWVETPVEPSAAPEPNPYLAVPTARVARAQAELQQTRKSAGGNPVLFVGGRHINDGAGENVDSLEASITLPIGTSSHTDVQRAQAALALSDAQAGLARAHREIDQRQHEAEHELEAARSTLSLAKERAEIATESGRLARRSFDLGELSLAEYLRQHARALSAVREAALRRLELDRQIARYNQALGVTP